MGTISSSTGLISGMDIESIVTQLMSIESKVKENVVTQQTALTDKQKAVKTIQAYVMTLQVAAANFNKQSVFQQKSVTSSNEDVLSATATKYAAAGTYYFKVNRLASNYHAISGAYSSLNSGIGQGTVSFEIGSGQLVRETAVQTLNGGQGIARGTIRITDRAGNQADIDLSTAISVKDIVDTINQNSTVQVTASVSGDKLVITDNSGSTSGNLIVADVDGGSTAQDLGIAASVSANTINGQNINQLSAQTLLKDLNDGAGVRGLSGTLPLDPDLTFSWGTDNTSGFNVALSSSMFKGTSEAESTTLKSLNGGAGVRLGKIRITDQNGVDVDIDLSSLGQNATVGQLKNYIETQAAAGGLRNSSGASTITLNYQSLDHLTIVDSSTNTTTDTNGVISTTRKSQFIIEDLEGGHAAEDLGIADSVSYGTITGSQVWYMDTLGDVINAVNNNYANTDGAGNKLVELAINDAGTGLKVVNKNSSTGGDLSITSNAQTDKWAAEDLGLLTNSVSSDYSGRRLIGSLNSVLLRSLNGGNSRDVIGTDGSITYGSDRIVDMAAENLTITDSAGKTLTYNTGDLSGIETLQDLIDRVNQDAATQGVGVKLAANSVGNGISLTDTAGGSGSLAVSSDTTGLPTGTVGLADKLNISVDASAGLKTVDSGNLQLQYYNTSTLLSDMRNGQGVRRGSFTIKDSSGHTFTISLAQDKIKTLGDVVDEINSAYYGPSENRTYSTVKARINDSGDGILLTDSKGSFTVAESGGQTAHDLGFLNTAKKQSDGSYTVDGTSELRLDIGGGDSIEDIVSKINAADMGIQASIINTGSTTNPSYRISFNSEIGGRIGRVYIDAGQTSLKTTTLSKGDDALVLYGEPSGSPVLITSHSNTLDSVVKGVTVDLLAADDQAVAVTVDNDVDNIVTQINSFVSGYNLAMKSLAEYMAYDSESQTKGALFADSTARTVQQSLEGFVSKIYGAGNINRLSQVGLTFSSFASESGTQVTQDGDKTINYAVAGTLQLSFDETKFRDAYTDDPESVTNFFTQTTTGFGDYIANMLEDLGSTSDSTISRSLDAIGDKYDMLQDRIDYLTERLSTKETQLYNQFYAMEETLAKLQTQQSALTQLSSLISS